MDFGKTASGLISSAESHATLLAFLGATLARAGEDGGDMIGNTIAYLNPLQDPSSAGPIHELMVTFSSVANLKWKLLDSPHLSTTIGKFATAVWAAGKLIDVIPPKYVTLAGKIAVGAYAAAIVEPGSGPSSNGAGMGTTSVQSMAQQAGRYTSNPLQGSTLNSAAGQQALLGSYQSVYPSNPTAGTLYTNNTSRLIGN